MGTHLYIARVQDLFKKKTDMTLHIKPCYRKRGNQQFQRNEEHLQTPYVNICVRPKQYSDIDHVIIMQMPAHICSNTFQMASRPFFPT